ncbi:MAG: lytic transglycosylase F, partial [Gemmatimonadetes bacterium]|nr:lytic transglycosylase F [Gemmatimonadota bacterium]
MGRRLLIASALLAVVAAVLAFWLGRQQQDQEERSYLPVRPDFSHLALITEPRTDDFDGMAERRTIRALVVRSKTFYFFDGAVQRGLSYDRLKAFEAYVNDRRDTGSPSINMVFLPVTRDQLIPALLAGYGDLAAANLTITPERQAQVDFSIPVQREVREILVTGPASEPIAAIEDLSGKTLHTRLSSSYHESLTALNEHFAASGLPPVDIVPVDEHLEDEELLEMVNASLMPRIVIDSHKAEFWAQILDSIEIRPGIVLRDHADIAWAFRPGSPKLKAMVDGFLTNVREGSLTGNLLLQRYLKETRYVENALHSSEMRKFDETAHLFQEYGDRYDFDWLMVMSQAYQESRLDQSLRSHAGAIGVM